MHDTSQLPHLIRLLEDDSPFVQQAIRKELNAYGDELDNALTSIGEPPTPEQWDHLKIIRADQRRARLIEEWPSWFKLENSYVQLETAFSLISNYMSLHVRPGELTRKLNILADEFRMNHPKYDAYDLAQYLFKAEGFRGCQSGYYTPEKSNLLETLQLHEGNPISLTCIFMLMGYRLNLPVHGCNFPGHFLGIATVGKERVLVDCFNGGRFIPPSSFKENNDSDAVENLESLVNTPAEAHVIVRRVLNNLLNAYTLQDDDSNAILIKELITIQQEQLEDINSVL
jgi:hypothetical protein